MEWNYLSGFRAAVWISGKFIQNISEGRLARMEEFTVKIPGRVYSWKVALDNGRIAGMERVTESSEGLWLTRGMMDIQVNGYQGVLVTSQDLDLEKLEFLENELAREGVTRWCPTVTTNEPKLIVEVLGKLAEAIDKGALKRVHCIHTEAN